MEWNVTATGSLVPIMNVWDGLYFGIVLGVVGVIVLLVVYVHSHHKTLTFAYYFPEEFKLEMERYIAKVKERDRHNL